MTVKLFDYELPPELIAQYPAEKRDLSRMMALNRKTGECEILSFREIVRFLSPGDAMIFNDTKVMRCRMYGKKDGRHDGASFEMLLLELLDPGKNRWKALLRPGKRATENTRIDLLDRSGNINLFGDFATVTGKIDDAFAVEFSNPDIELLQERYGHMPLPPYIKRSDKDADSERYQTVFAKNPGAVAAPTAGLHFSPEILSELKNKSVNFAAVTLHVGIGTFRPVSVENVGEHKMHSEQFTLPGETAKLIAHTRSSGHKVLAVGTTTVRVLESCLASDGTSVPQSGKTDIFLHPPYQIKSADMLLTNFHLPQSTLLMLISCFADREKILAAYQKAIEAKMRFFSYGDCMLLY